MLRQALFVLTAALLGAHSVTCPAPSRAATVDASAIAKLQQNLSQQLDAHLKQKLGRTPIKASVTLTPAGCAGCYRLTVPAHILRDTVFDVQLKMNGKTPVLSGRLYSAAERDLIAKAVSSAFGTAATVNIETFPFSNVGKDYAITKTQADLYVEPKPVAGENLATQARLGTPLQVLEYSADKKMARVRVTDDGYIAWIQRSQIIEGEQGWYQDWLNKRQVLLMNPVNQPVNLPVGTRLKLVSNAGSMLQASLPDGRAVSLNRSDVVLNTPGQLPAVEAVIKTSRNYLPKAPQGGGAYLWGGTYGTRLDCSGFIQTIWRLNGVYLPRDADQQQGFTQDVAPTLAQINELKPGDLVFFTNSKRDHATHVGMYIGNYQFIHSSPKGPYTGVKISTLKGGGEYDKMLQGIYFGGGRVTRSL